MEKALGRALLVIGSVFLIIWGGSGNGATGVSDRDGAPRGSGKRAGASALRRNKGQKAVIREIRGGSFEKSAKSALTVFRSARCNEQSPLSMNSVESVVRIVPRDVACRLKILTTDDTDCTDGKPCESRNEACCAEDSARSNHCRATAPVAAGLGGGRRSSERFREQAPALQSSPASTTGRLRDRVRRARETHARCR